LVVLQYVPRGFSGNSSVILFISLNSQSSPLASRPLIEVEAAQRRARVAKLWDERRIRRASLPPDERSRIDAR
jgi:hypothetical protein